jgi:hypothetical protein
MDQDQSRDIEPTGGWKQYKMAVRVLVAFPMVMLLCALLGMLALPRFHPSSHVEVVPPTSHEPFHFSLSVLPPLKAPNPAVQ